jgi:hypothetical protein
VEKQKKGEDKRRKDERRKRADVLIVSFLLFSF